MTGTYLAHYGVKGMKWGVRKKPSGGRPGITVGGLAKSAIITPVAPFALPMYLYKGLRKPKDKPVRKAVESAIADISGADQHTVERFRKRGAKAVVWLMRANRLGNVVTGI